MNQPVLPEPTQLLAPAARRANRAQRPTVTSNAVSAGATGDSGSAIDAVVVSGRTPSPRAFGPSASVLDTDGTSAGSTPLSPAAFLFFGREGRASRTAGKMLLAAIYMGLGSSGSIVGDDVARQTGGDSGLDLADLAILLADSGECI